jgi:methyltransferase (TIGR00027 family)
LAQQLKEACAVETDGKADGRIEHVSDTALMVAACRAMETERPDGLVRDLYAARLAGERGMAIARALPIPELWCFGVGVRVKSMDEILMTALNERRVTTVLNLGAGLDTRPWRLELPPALRWIEVDFPHMLEYKARQLAGEKPRCRLEQKPADLSDDGERRKVFKLAGLAETLLITEGLLEYLPRAAVVALATEAPRLSGIRYWLLDATSEHVTRAIRGGRSPIQKVLPEDRMTGETILDITQRAGWTFAQKRTYAEGGKAISAERSAQLREAMAKKMDLSSMMGDDPVSGVYLFRRNGSD